MNSIIFLQRRRIVAALWAALAVASPPGAPAADGSEAERGRGRPWERHTIDDSSRGADGVRLADANGDGLLDVVTGWEEGGVVRLCLNPGKDRVASRWPGVLVGRAPSVEDAFFAHVDSDGALDVISLCEGRERSVFVHWAPSSRERILDDSAWRTEAVPAARGKMMWMFGTVRADETPARVMWAGGKGAGAELGWFEMGEGNRLAEWTWRSVRPMGWLMSLVFADMDGDEDADLIFSDRKGSRRGCYWLERPAGNWRDPSEWKERAIGARDREVMFVAPVDLDRDGRLEVAAAVKPREIIVFSSDGGPVEWRSQTIEMPADTGTPKAVAAGDLDLDGTLDLAVSCEGASDGRSGVVWFSRRPFGEWRPRELSGAEGIKFDLVELIDLDFDGDLDVLTCEEAENLGVIWYENPIRSRRAIGAP